MDTLLVVLVAAFFAAMGLVALAWPTRVLAYFGTRELTRDGRNEVRAVYGGFGLAIAGLLLASFGLPGIRNGILTTIAVALLGMAGGRLIATLLDGPPGFYPWLFFSVEIVLASLLIASL